MREQDFLNVFGAGVALVIIGTVSPTSAGCPRTAFWRFSAAHPLPLSQAAAPPRQ